MDDFTGVKVALLLGDELVMIQRDKKPGLRFAGLWDFPGGAREGDETALQCVAREVDEELALKLRPETIVWQKKRPAMHDAKLSAYFMVARITQSDVKAIKFGNEGLGWKLMAIKDFMAAEDVVEPLKARLEEYLANQ